MAATLDHIGIAVNQLPELERLFEILDLRVTHREPVVSQGVMTHFVPLGVRPGRLSQLEFLEAQDPQGTIAQFIKKRGPGIHHLSFLLDSGTLDAVTSRIRAAGFRLIYEEARPGAHGMRVNFIHPASAGGILIEIMEPEDRGNQEGKL